MATIASKKTARIEIRLTEAEKDIVVRAAKALGQDLSSFFLGQILPKAKETLLFEDEWRKNEQSVAHLLEILSAEPKEVPKLRELLSQQFDHDYGNTVATTEG